MDAAAAAGNAGNAGNARRCQIPGRAAADRTGGVDDAPGKAAAAACGRDLDAIFGLLKGPRIHLIEQGEGGGLLH